jgi:hypothetical protein
MEADQIRERAHALQGSDPEGLTLIGAPIWPPSWLRSISVTIAAVPLDDEALGGLLDELEVGLDLNSVAPEIEPMLAALMRQASKAVLEQAAGDAVEAVWSDELERELVTELDEFRELVLEDDPELVATVDAARAELGRAPRQNQVAHALVWRAALKLLQRANRNYERMAELEQALADAPPAAHRRLTLRVSVAATLAAGIGDEEAANAIARYVFSLPANAKADSKQLNRANAQLARTLATEGGRRKVRASLAELAQVSADEFPLSSAALQRLLAEPIPKDPAKDELWVRLVVGLAEEQLAEVLADETLGS